MRETIRTTRECMFDSLNSTLAEAIRTHIEKHELGDVTASTLMCCETASTKQKKGLFGGKAGVMLTGIMLTPQWLIWATGSENEAPGVLSSRLRDIQVQDYEKSDQFKLIQDTGLDISGLRINAVDRGSAFIGLGPEPAAEKFRAMLKEALAKA